MLLLFYWKYYTTTTTPTTTTTSNQPDVHTGHEANMKIQSCTCCTSLCCALFSVWVKCVGQMSHHSRCDSHWEFNFKLDSRRSQVLAGSSLQQTPVSGKFHFACTTNRLVLVASHRHNRQQPTTTHDVTSQQFRLWPSKLFSRWYHCGCAWQLLSQCNLRCSLGMSGVTHTGGGANTSITGWFTFQVFEYIGTKSFQCDLLKVDLPLFIWVRQQNIFTMSASFLL